jgi:hypothetical protein
MAKKFALQEKLGSYATQRGLAGRCPLRFWGDQWCSDSARCDWEIEEVAEAALLPVAPTLRSGKLDRPVKYRCFRRSNFWPYGVAGCRVGFVVWMWLSTTVVLIGAEINAEMEHQTAKDTTEGGRKPMGARGARMADEIGEARS